MLPFCLKLAPLFEGATIKRAAIPALFGDRCYEVDEFLDDIERGPAALVAKATTRTFPKTFCELGKARLNAMAVLTLLCVYAHDFAKQQGQPYATFTMADLNASATYVVRGPNHVYVRGFGAFILLTQDSMESKSLLAALTAYFGLNATPCTMIQSGVPINGFTLFGQDVPTFA